MHIELATTDDEIIEAAAVLNQLRPQYSREALVSQIKMQQKNGYQLAYVRSDGRIIAVAGFVFGEKLAWGRHIYVDDLVTDEDSRGSGAGTALIAWLKAYCVETGCTQLHLDSGVQRFGAHRFYLRLGFDIKEHHFSISDLKG
ncbi:MAG: GNAT family N-acetyltransferase [Woeseiaceae bacterium]|nr:GNAT family N-acetyltransferase [Woeseiaceae bacterium]